MSDELDTLDEELATANAELEALRVKNEEASAELKRLRTENWHSCQRVKMKIKNAVNPQLWYILVSTKYNNPSSVQAIVTLTRRTVPAFDTPFSEDELDEIQAIKDFLAGAGITITEVTTTKNIIVELFI